MPESPHTPDPRSVLAREPKALQLLELLRGLPRFDRSKKARDLQGDLPEVAAAEAQYHGWNSSYQHRDDSGVTRSPVLVALFQDAEWVNFQLLLRHSTRGRQRRAVRNKTFRDKLSPLQVYEANRAKRRQRLDRWLADNEPRFLRLIAEAEQGHAYDVLNELEARLVDEHRAQHEYVKLMWRVVLGRHTQSPDAESLRRVMTVASELFEEGELEVEVKKALALKLPPIEDTTSSVLAQV